MTEQEQRMLAKGTFALGETFESEIEGSANKNKSLMGFNFSMKFWNFRSDVFFVILHFPRSETTSRKGMKKRKGKRENSRFV